MENRNNTINYMNSSDTLNVCPVCGNAAYEIETEYAMHHVGCIHCGISRGISNDIMVNDDIAEEIRIRARREWNERCLDSYYTEEALEVLGIRDGNYVLIDNRTCTIAKVVPSVTAAKDYILEHNDVAFRILLNLDGILQDPGHSWVIRELFEQ